MKGADKARIDSLLHALRAWDSSSEKPLRVDDLAKRFQLDPLVVRRIAQAEGVPVSNGEGVPEPVDDESETGPIDLGEG